MNALEDLLAPYADEIAKFAGTVTCLQFLSGVFLLIDIRRKGSSDTYPPGPILGGVVLYSRKKEVECQAMQQPVLLVHGGAGAISDVRVDGKLNGMKQALRTAFPLLIQEIPDEELSAEDRSKEVNMSKHSTPALDAVEAAVRCMELDENFNAGFGSCLNADGNVEVEASIMEGACLDAGCVTLLHDIMHPISVARKVMEQTNHTFIGGAAAMSFAQDQGFEVQTAGSLVTESARQGLEEFRERQRLGLDTKFARTELDRKMKVQEEETRPGEPGTVGAVAIDANGNIAVATSTGGIMGKIPGRIGDTPLLGCGTYADNRVGGVSTTGHGETIMRFNLAQKILEKMKYEGRSAQQAVEMSCQEMTERLTGTGGAITIDAKGKVGIYWTSKRMAWAYMKGNELCYGIDHGKSFKEVI